MDKRALRMASLFRGNLIGTRHRQISSGPEPNIVRQRPACTGHEIRDALQAGEFHLVTGLFLVFIFLFLRRRAAGKQPFDHKLKESILGRELCASAKSGLPDPVDRVALRPVLPGKTHIDPVLPKPSYKAYKAGVDPQDVGAHRAPFFLELKGRPLVWIFKYAAGMVLPLPRAVVQDQNRLIRRSLRRVGTENCIGTHRLLLFLRRIVKIKYRHNLKTPHLLFFHMAAKRSPAAQYQPARRLTDSCLSGA